MTPAVSVVLTTYNGATRGYLRQAIDSVVAQSDPDFELLIVDDGSSDGTKDLCEQYLADARVRYLPKENGGVASARNAGVAAARAELICFLDDDDVWAPEKLERQRQEFKGSEQELALVYSAIEVTDAAGQVRDLQYHEVTADPYRTLFYENIVDATSTVMVRARAISSTGAFREDIFAGALQGCEDRELWSRIARKFKFRAIRQPLVRYRMHGVKLSTTADNMERSELAMLDIALADAPEDIVADSSNIYRSVYMRFAHNRFTTGEYAAFRRHFLAARKCGPVSTGLWIRYLLTFFPPAIPVFRRILPTKRFSGTA